jgi:hypothetical protein|tara:strand:+ start:898 stop:1644 length:747 start_codon:yes stop_codon:yes gene_type:complete
MADNFNTLLNQIKSKKKNISSHINSFEEEVSFEKLNIEQQSKILDSYSDIPALSNNAVYLVLKFNNTFNKIIRENLIDKNIDLNVVDRANIILMYRKELGDTVLVDDNEININSVLENNKSIKKIDLEKTFQSGDFTFKVKVPSLINDIKVNNLLMKKIRENPSKNDVLGEIYLYELLKFIDFMQIDENDAIILNKDNRNLDLLKNVEVSILKPVLDYIEYVRSFEEKFVTVEGTSNKIYLTPELFII